MKPGDHPDFFRMAPPPGASRQSTIALDREGHFWHDGARVDHPALARALRGWIALHPDERVPILTNGYDWCYFRVEDVPYFVTALHEQAGAVTVTLFDDTTEPLDPATLSVDPEGVVYAKVKGGRFDARFTRHAQTQLAPLLVGDEPVVRLAGKDYRFAPRGPRGASPR